jgi:hypothetical protein
MRVPFSEFPGRHERHYRRRLGNALFPRALGPVTDQELLEVQRLDHEELLAFLGELRGVVQRAVDLKPNEETQVVLDLKADLERLYETSAALADEQHGNRSAIRQLIAVIMRTIWAGAAGDPLAEAELDQEEAARTAHFELLQQPLVAELLHPASLIAADELLPTLLSESTAAVAAACQLFDAEQLAELLAGGRVLLTERDPAGERYPEAQQRLAQLEQRLQALRPAGSLN